MKTLKLKIKDFALRRGQYADCGLKVDYGMWLAEQSGFEVFNDLFRQVKMVYQRGEADDEMHKLTTAFVNSLFCGECDAPTMDDLLDRFSVDRLVFRQLAMIADCYKSKRTLYSAEKVILMQSLASLADFGQTDKFPYLFSLVPFLLIRELTDWVDDVFKFESEQATIDNGSVRLRVKKTLYYLSQEQKYGLIITTKQYEQLVDEVCELITQQQLPADIEQLEVNAKRSLASGYSWKFVTYGIGLLYRKNQLPRELWIDYLSYKLSKPKSSLLKKFTARPDFWEQTIIRE